MFDLFFLFSYIYRARSVTIFIGTLKTFKAPCPPRLRKPITPRPIYLETPSSTRVKSPPSDTDATLRTPVRYLSDIDATAVTSLRQCDINARVKINFFARKGVAGKKKAPWTSIEGERTAEFSKDTGKMRWDAGILAEIAPTGRKAGTPLSFVRDVSGFATSVSVL